MKNVKGMYGYFDVESDASYVCRTINMPVSWEYIYQNRDVLLRVDQYGPVNAQANPPQDIMLFKRGKDDRFSKWCMWLRNDKINKGFPVSNFFRPFLGGLPGTEPDDIKIKFRPNCVEYYYEYQGLAVQTVLSVPASGIDILMKTRVENLVYSELEMDATLSFVPYVNRAQLAPWDKPEWYLRTGFGREDDLVFWTQLLSPVSNPDKRRVVSMWCKGDGLDSVEISLERFAGAGDISNPEGIYGKKLDQTYADCRGFGEYTNRNIIYGYPPVYAAVYKFMLARGEKKEFIQVLSLLPNGDRGGLPDRREAKRPCKFFCDNFYAGELLRVEETFKDLFGKRMVKTRDEFFDYYVNSWLPLQMHWVAALDRGWPTGMRGTRDCCNDFMGEMYADSDWARSILRDLFSCQRSDGWFPRQISTEGRQGQHDLRQYVDGGAFVIEFLYEYISFTGDMELLNENCKWLDTEIESTVFEHALRCVEYYLASENIGEHGLCKIREGDWLDSVNRAGIEGRGESVMVTAQVVMAIEYLLLIAQAGGISLACKELLSQAKADFSENLLGHAYNKKGFFNGLFNDDGRWIFSDSDPDGESRIYISANAYAVISGIASGKVMDSVISNLETLKCELGYRLYWPPMGKIPIEKVGRAGSGDMPPGRSENGNPYNHGSHGFLGRALSVAGRGDKLYEVLKYMLPYEQKNHPTDRVMTPPYAVVNSWEQVPGYVHRGGMLFLTGTIAMALRLIYNWMFGIKPELDALVIDPCMPACMDSVNIKFQIRGKKIDMTVKNRGEKFVSPDKLILNGSEAKKKRKALFSSREVYYIPYGELLQDNEIVVSM